MKNIKKIIFSLFVFFLLASPSVLLAQNCTGTAVCNPSPGFFVDLKQGNTFQGILVFLVQALIGIVGVASVAFIIIGGFQMITSRGNEEQAEAGKKTLTNAIIGLVVVLISYTVVTVIINAVNGKI